ncbi:yopX family protein [Streptococcus oralis]|uniref:YopX family protein n=1 Tax=Streptococcus oralis TaxID=1303 RepID=A0A081R6M7_STROR|nr:YopX family protein [Streptococcus oralis]KEQ50850.1 yopX family protein [Streptococcus oralis]
MRPKFRAWDGAKKEMFKDTFAITESGQVVVVEQEFVTSPPDYVFVDHLVIMQSTGIKDKNGKEIFEGDIIITNAHACIVSFGGYTYFEDADTETTEVGFYLSYLNVSPATYSPFEKFFWEKCQVIGNIYKNELDLIMYEAWKFNKELEDET